MSSKRYEYKVLESAELPELERKLTELGAQGWSAEGYGVLPSGQRSVLLSRKRYEGDRHKSHHHHGPRPATDREPQADDRH